MRKYPTYLMDNLSPGNQNAQRTEWGWLKSKKTNERYPKWNKAKYLGNLDSNQQIGTKGRNKYPTKTEWRNKNLKKWGRLRNLWDNFKHYNIWIIGVPEGEEEEQEVENLFEQIMKENFPHLAKEIDFQEGQEAQRVPKKLDPRRNTPRHIIITWPRIK